MDAQHLNAGRSSRGLRAGWTRSVAMWLAVFAVVAMSVSATAAQQPAGAPQAQPKTPQGAQAGGAQGSAQPAAPQSAPGQAAPAAQKAAPGAQQAPPAGQQAPAKQPAPARAPKQPAAQPAGKAPAAAPRNGGQPAQKTQQPAAAARQPAPAPKQPAGAEPQTPPPVAKPKYKQLSDFGGQEEKAWLKKRLEIQSILRGGNLAPDQQTTVREYYEKYALARWTVEEKFPQLPTFRKELRLDFRRTRGTPAHGFLQQVAFDFLLKIATNADGTYHPAARYNALLAIAEMNSVEAPSASKPPTPLPRAVPVLADALEDANGTDAMKVAALVGLRRHAALGIEDSQIVTGRLLPALLKLATTKAPPPGRSLEGHLWMRARAIETLGLLGLPGDQQQVVDALVAIVAEEGGPMMPRCAAAWALGMIDYQQAGNASAAQLAAALGQLAADACADEVSQMEKEIEQEAQQPVPGTTGYGMMLGGGEAGVDEAYQAYEQMYGGSGMPGARTKKRDEEEEDHAPNNRRRLKARLNAVFVGITGVDHHVWRSAGKPMDGIATTATNQADQQLVQNLLGQIQKIVDLCDQKQPDKQAFRDKIEAEAAKLRELLAQIGGVAAATQRADTGA